MGEEGNRASGGKIEFRIYPAGERATIRKLFILIGTVLLITYVPWLTTAPLRRLGR